MSEPVIFKAFNGSRIIWEADSNLQLTLRHNYAEMVLSEGHDEALQSRFLDITAADLMILKAARVSTHKAGMTTAVRDRKLLKYLFDHKHTSVFEQVTYQFTVIMPLYIAAQWKRHRTWHMNEFSRRYTGADWVEFEDRSSVHSWHKQNTEEGTNKQGGDCVLLWQDRAWAIQKYKQMCDFNLETYTEALNRGMAKEDARVYLGVHAMTCIMFTVDLHNLVGFLLKRCAPDAQREIRVLAYILKDDLVRVINPWVHELIDEEFYKRGWPLEYT